MTEGTTQRAFVLGLDGVPWDLLSEWVDDGELPNFARLSEEGVAGPLESTTPATTPLAWPSIATGVQPDKHGIYAWRSLSEAYNHQMYTGSDVDRPFLWDMLSPSIVGNVPMTYPADDIDGEMVAGLMTPEMEEGFTSPDSLREEIQERVPDYDIGLYWEDYDGASERFQQDLQSMVEGRRELMRLLMEREEWRLFFFVYTAPDRLQHLVWDESVLLDHYRYLDEIVGEAMDYVEERDATLYVVSDHGFGPVSTYVAPNRVLADEGFLVAREESGTRSTFEELGLTRSTVLDALERVGIDQGTLVEHLPRSLIDTVAEQIPGDNVLYDVDFTETTAFAHGEGSVYVNRTDRFEQGQVPPEDVPEVKEAVAETLRGITDPATGEPVLEVRDGDELFPTDPDSPDLVVEGLDGYEVALSWRDRDVLSDAGRMAAGHRPEGVLFAWGDDVAAGATPDDATVFDLAPTVLHGVGEPVPETADGRVLDEIFAPDSDPASASIRTEQYAAGRETTEVDEDLDEVEDRLRGLGYME